MSNSHIFLKSGFPQAPLTNGIGRYVCQLQRVTLKYCKNTGASRGMREFLESDLLDFASKNPGIVVYVKPRRHKSPTMTAEYLNGDTQFVFCRNYSREEVAKWLNLLRTQQGNHTNMRLRKMWHTDYPSIQSPWTPFTFKNPASNLVIYPDEEAGKAIKLEPTATEKLYEIFKEQQRDLTSLEKQRAE